MAQPLTPRLHEPLKCFDAGFWAFRNGICAALGGGAAWALLSALYNHLPNVKVGTRRLADESGLSLATVKVARRRLRAVGLIDYADSAGGDNRQAATTVYRLADVRRDNIAVDCCQRIAGEVTAKSAAGPAAPAVPAYSADDPPAVNEDDITYMDDDDPGESA